MVDGFGFRRPINGGMENPGGGGLVASGARAWVAVEATDSLEEEIGGG